MFPTCAVKSSILKRLPVLYILYDGVINISINLLSLKIIIINIHMSPNKVEY